MSPARVSTVLAAFALAVVLALVFARAFGEAPDPGQKTEAPNPRQKTEPEDRTVITRNRYVLHGYGTVDFVAPGTATVAMSLPDGTNCTCSHAVWESGTGGWCEEQECWFLVVDPRKARP